MDPIDISSYLPSVAGIQQGFITVLGYLFAALVVAGIIAIIYVRKFRYPVPVILKQRLGKGSNSVPRTWMESARVYRDLSGNKRIELMHRYNGRRPQCPHSGDEYAIWIGNKLGFELYLDSNGELHPISTEFPADNNANTKVRDQNRDNFRLQIQKEQEEKFKKVSTFMQLAPYFVVMAALFICFLMIYFVSDKSVTACGNTAQICTGMITECTKIVGGGFG